MNRAGPVTIINLTGLNQKGKRHGLNETYGKSNPNLH